MTMVSLFLIHQGVDDCTKSFIYPMGSVKERERERERKREAKFG